MSYDYEKVVFNGKQYNINSRSDRGSLKKVLLGYGKHKGEEYTELSIHEMNSALTSLSSYYSSDKAKNDHKLRWVEFLNQFNTQVVVPLSLKNPEATQIFNSVIGTQIQLTDDSINSSNISLSSSSSISLSNIGLSSSLINLTSTSTDLMPTIPTQEIETVPQFNEEYILEHTSEQYRDRMQLKLDDNRSNPIKTIFGLYISFYNVVLPKIIDNLVKYGKISEETDRLIQYNFGQINSVVFHDGELIIDKQDLTLLKELQLISTDFTSKFYSNVSKILVENCKNYNDYESFNGNRNFTNGVVKLGNTAGVSTQRTTYRWESENTVPHSSNAVNNNKMNQKRSQTVFSKEQLEQNKQKVIGKDNILFIVPISYFPAMEIEHFEENMELLRPIVNNESIVHFVMEGNELIAYIMRGLSNFIENKGKCNIASLRELNNRLNKNFGININDLSNARPDFIAEYVKENNLEGQVDLDQANKLIECSQLAKKINNDRFEDIVMDESKYKQKHPSLFI